MNSHRRSCHAVGTADEWRATQELPGIGAGLKVRALAVDDLEDLHQELTVEDAGFCAGHDVADQVLRGVEFLGAQES